MKREPFKKNTVEGNVLQTMQSYKYKTFTNICIITVLQMYFLQL